MNSRAKRRYNLFMLAILLAGGLVFYITPAHADGGQAFGPNESWTNNPYYGNQGTFFADVTGDGRADAIVVNDSRVPSGRVVVRRSTGTQFLPNEQWTTEPFYGSRGTFFADINGDRRADAIAITDQRVMVRLSDGTRFTAAGGQPP